MSEPYELLVLIPDGAEAERTVRAVDRALLAAGGELNDESELRLGDVGDDEGEFEPIEDADEALTRLIAWPTLGMLLYDTPEGFLSVSYEGGDGRVSAITMATPRTFNDLTEDALARYRGVGQDLHDELHAARTMLGWGLSSRGHGWREELDRSSAGDYTEIDDLMVDLRRDPTD